MHGGLKKGLGSMGSSMRNLGGSMSPPKMPSFKRPSSPFGRKSPTPVEEPSEEPIVNAATGEKTVVFSPEPEAGREPEPEPAAPEPAVVIPETEETHLAAAKLQASVRGRNARKKTKRRKGPRTSADIRQEIAELDEEGFREDEARNLAVGVFYVVLSGLVFSCMGVFIRIASAQMPSSQIILISGLVRWALLLVLVSGLIHGAHSNMDCDNGQYCSYAPRNGGGCYAYRCFQAGGCCNCGNCGYGGTNTSVGTASRRCRC